MTNPIKNMIHMGRRVVKRQSKKPDVRYFWAHGLLCVLEDREENVKHAGDETLSGEFTF